MTFKRDTAEHGPANVADEGDILAAEVIDQTLRLSVHLRERLADALSETGLNESRLSVLRVVAARGQTGCSQVELATAMRQAESSICTLVDRMKQDKLLHRMHSKLDRRKSFLLLTEQGRATLDAAETAVHGVAVEIRQLWNTRSLEPMRAMLEAALFELERPAASANAPSTRKAA